MIIRYSTIYRVILMLICSQYNSREGTEHDMPPHEYESTNVSISDPLTSYNLYSALFICIETSTYT